VKEIGRGAFGVVYKGKWRSATVNCAVKVLFGDLDAQSLEDFRQEGLVHKKLRPHSNVVQFFGICIQDKKSMIVTEYLPGGSLDKFLSSEVKIQFSTVLKLIRGIASGMWHLTSEGIIHRDLAARNCLLTSDYTVKVCDFGMSRFAQEKKHNSGSNVGPLKWMAPESIRENSYSEKTDVYAFGVVLYECMSRGEPYDEMDGVVAATLVAKGELSLEAPDQSNPSLALLMKDCLSYDANSRPTFQQICGRLGHIGEVSEDSIIITSGKRFSTSVKS